MIDLSCASIAKQLLIYSTAMYLGTAIGQLALGPPTSIASRTIQVWDYSPTGMTS